MKSSKLLTPSFISIVLANYLFALPQNGEVVRGEAEIKALENKLDIKQTSDRAVVNWGSFSVDSGESVNISQPDRSSIILNRVTGQDPSKIHGAINANGQVWVINPNGLLIGENAEINVGGFLGSTLDIKDEDFMNGNYIFKNNIESSVKISNLGSIKTSEGGYIAFLSPVIENKGLLEAPKGDINLLAGDEIKLNFSGNSLIGYSIDKKSAQDLVNINNEGKISANGGEVILSAKALAELPKAVINNSGIIEAQTVAEVKGVIKLLGDMEDDKIVVSGTLDASAPNGGDGGFINTSAANVKIEDDIKVTTKASDGKTGEWLIDPTDFHILPSGGQISGQTLQSQLANSDITIESTNSNDQGNGDILVRDSFSWSQNKLTLKAQRKVAFFETIYATGSSTLEIWTNGRGDGGVINPYKNPDSVIVTNGATVNFMGRTGQDILLIDGINYYLIDNLNDIKIQDPDRSSGNIVSSYALTKDISVGSHEPIKDFYGIFNGLGHRMNNVNINKPTSSNVGIFDVLGGAVINFAEITGSVTGYRNVGLVAGKLYGGTIAHLHTKGDVTGHYRVGGVAGSASEGYGTITYVQNFASVKGIADNSKASAQVGGIIGSTNAKMINVINTGNVEGHYEVGGIVGTLYNGGELTNPENQGAVKGGTQPDLENLNSWGSYVSIENGLATINIGGIAGSSEGSLNGNIINTGTVSGTGNTKLGSYEKYRERVGNIIGSNGDISSTDPDTTVDNPHSSSSDSYSSDTASSSTSNTSSSNDSASNTASQSSTPTQSVYQTSNVDADQDRDNEVTNIINEQRKIDIIVENQYKDQVLVEKEVSVEEVDFAVYSGQEIENDVITEINKNNAKQFWEDLGAIQSGASVSTGIGIIKLNTKGTLALKFAGYAVTAEKVLGMIAKGDFGGASKEVAKQAISEVIKAFALAEATGTVAKAFGSVFDQMVKKIDMNNLSSSFRRASKENTIDGKTYISVTVGGERKIEQFLDEGLIEDIGYVGRNTKGYMLTAKGAMAIYMNETCKPRYYLLFFKKYEYEPNEELAKEISGWLGYKTPTNPDNT